MPQAPSFRRIFTRFFPRKATHPLSEAKQWPALSDEEKIQLASRYLSQGEIALRNEDLSAVSYFEAAETLTPDSFEVCYRSGLAFFDYGLTEGKEKALLLASRYFKLAAHHAPHRFEAWTAWGSVLLQLGIAYEEHHYYLEAKEKFQRALSFSPLPRPVLAQLHWDYGLVWTELSQQSGEAVDVRLAISSFTTALEHLDTPTPEFFNDSGNAYLQMGLLINDSRLYLQAVEHLRRSIALSPRYIDGLASLGNAYAQLYINTASEAYALDAIECYERLCREDPADPEHWLCLSELLSESGRVCRDARKLRLAVEKAAHGYALDPEHPRLLCQWVEALSHLGAHVGRLDLLIEAENKILSATDQFPDDPDLWHAYGICLIAFGQYYGDPDYYEYAIEKLQHGLSLDRTYAEIWHALALAHSHLANLTDDLDMIERSVRFYTRALDLKPACPTLLFDAANAWLLACDLRDDPKDLDQALQLYELLFQTQREALLHHPEWLFQYATALEWLSEYTAEEIHLAKAIDLYLHVLLIDPEIPQIHFRIALAYTHLGEHTLDADTYRRALTYFRFAARHDEEDESVWLEWGLACIHLAHQSLDPAPHYADAEQKLLRAGRLGNLNAHYTLACLYSLLHRFSDAMEFIHKAAKSLALPPIEDMLDDEWLDNLRHTEAFAEFLAELETKHENEH